MNLVAKMTVLMESLAGRLPLQRLCFCLIYVINIGGLNDENWSFG